MSDGFLTPQKEVLPATEVAPQEELSPVKLDELALEQLEAEKKEDEFLEEAEVPAAGGEKSSEAAPAAEVPTDELLTEVKEILEENLGIFESKFNPEVKKRFDDTGKLVARELTGQIRRHRLDSKKIHHAISRWLHTIPSVNKHFLEQEAKIKTDGLLRLAQEEQKKQNQIP